MEKLRAPGCLDVPGWTGKAAGVTGLCVRGAHTHSLSGGERQQQPGLFAGAPPRSSLRSPRFSRGPCRVGSPAGRPWIQAARPPGAGRGCRPCLTSRLSSWRRRGGTHAPTQAQARPCATEGAHRPDPRPPDRSARAPGAPRARGHGGARSAGWFSSRGGRNSSAIHRLVDRPRWAEKGTHRSPLPTMGPETPPRPASPERPAPSCRRSHTSTHGPRNRRPRPGSLSPPHSRPRGSLEGLTLPNQTLSGPLQIRRRGDRGCADAEVARVRGGDGMGGRGGLSFCPFREACAGAEGGGCGRERKQ